MKAHKHVKHIMIYSDCKMAVDGIAKGRQHTSKSKLGQLWASVWGEYEECLANGMHIEVLKVNTTKKTRVRCHKSYKMAIIAPITMQA